MNYVCARKTSGSGGESDNRALSKRNYEELAEFRYQLRRFNRVSEEISRSNGLTPLQYLLLLQLKGYPGREWASIGELAERLQAKHHGVVSLVDRCVDAGLVRRTKNKQDRRLVEVRLTAKGERFVRKLADLHRRELLALRGKLVIPEIDAPED